MEENKNQKKRKSVIDSSVVLSFVVSIFAIVSLAMFGIVSNQDTDISYAVPQGSVDSDYNVEIAKDDQGRILNIEGHGFDTEGNETNFDLYKYSVGRNQVYCIEYKKNVIDEDTYNDIETELSEEEETAILYIINATLDIPNVSASAKPYVETWIKQSAIWLYLFDKVEIWPSVIPHDSPIYLEDEEGHATRPNILSTTSIRLIHGAAATLEDVETIYENNTLGNTALKLSQDAKKAEAASVSTLTLNKASDDFTVGKDSEGKVAYYQSALITVTGSSELVYYEIKFSEEGIEAYDEDGNKLDITNPIQDVKKFYVRIPADKVKYPDSKKIDVTVNGVFAKPALVTGQAIQNPSAKQKIVRLSTKSEVVSKGVEIVVTPDTGVNATQAIYFIGLIVLLCGVGIVYANAKPVQSKQ